MKVKVWGCRGSLPTPGGHTVRYGGNTTCIEVRLKSGDLVIFDAGSGLRKLGKVLVAEKKINEMYLVVTHPHWDHLMGFPFFIPAYLPGYKIHVRGGPKAKNSLKTYLEQQMEAPYFPVPFNAMKAEFDFTQGDPEKRTIGQAELIPIRLSHPNGCYGFKLVEEGKSFVFFTDHELGYRHDSGLSREEYIDFCKNADLLFHDAQYTDNEYTNMTKGWGHSTFNAATDFAVDAGVKRFGIFHHDPDHTDEQLDEFVDACHGRVAQSGSSMECFAAMEGMTIRI